MTKLDKLIERIKARPPEADFADIERLLRAYGYDLDRQSGSHVTFTKEGAPPIPFPLKQGRRVKRHYLDRICNRLGL